MVTNIVGNILKSSVVQTTAITQAVVFSALVHDLDLAITYVDADLVITIRKVVPKSIKRCKNGELILKAFCVNRGAERNFRLDGIVVAETLL
jgi:predicted DNA-binding transcriptional regulator YafY